MSKLGEQIQKTQRVEPRRLGFGVAAAVAANPTLVVIALVDAGAASSGVEGADVLLLGDGRLPKNAPSRPFGVLQPELTQKDAAAVKEGGADFVVFDPDRTEAAALVTPDLGFVATVSPDLTDVELRVLEGLPLDAVYLAELPRPLTVRAQLGVQRIAVLASKPLLVPAAGLSAKELEGLREAGVGMVLADGRAAADVRKTVDSLPPRRRRREGGRTEPLLPRAPAGGLDEEGEEEDDGFEEP